MEPTDQTIVAQHLSSREWARFGWLPLNDTDPHDGDARLDFEWNDVHVNMIHHDLGEVTQTSKGLVCDVLFHHSTHTQALLVLNCPAVLVVAPSSFSVTDLPSVDDMRAFLLQPHDTVVLHRGTWHWGPFPVGAERVDLYNVQGLRYAEDNDSLDLASLGRAVEVIVDPVM
ncbi:MAG: uncharacterized protein JWO62_2769 [Acidimicrobiaceae bacterium]|jgi:hypothetical protein|nr:uncharacterized protein [Acidimicrobiaceae bacterium]